MARTTATTAATTDATIDPAPVAPVAAIDATTTEDATMTATATTIAPAADYDNFGPVSPAEATAIAARPAATTAPAPIVAPVAPAPVATTDTAGPVATVAGKLTRAQKSILAGLVGTFGITESYDRKARRHVATGMAGDVIVSALSAQERDVALLAVLGRRVAGPAGPDAAPAPIVAPVAPVATTAPAGDAAPVAPAATTAPAGTVDPAGTMYDATTAPAPAATTDAAPAGDAGDAAPDVSRALTDDERAAAIAAIAAEEAATKNRPARAAGSGGSRGPCTAAVQQTVQERTRVFITRMIRDFDATMPIADLRAHAVAAFGPDRPTNYRNQELWLHWGRIITIIDGAANGAGTAWATDAIANVGTFRAELLALINAFLPLASRGAGGAAPVKVTKTGDVIPYVPTFTAAPAPAGDATTAAHAKAYDRAIAALTGLALPAALHQAAIVVLADRYAQSPATGPAAPAEPAATTDAAPVAGDATTAEPAPAGDAAPVAPVATTAATIAPDAAPDAAPAVDATTAPAATTGDAAPVAA